MPTKLIILLLLLSSCMPPRKGDFNENLKDDLEKILNDNPEILENHLKKNKKTIIPLIFNLIDDVNEDKLMAQKSQMEALYEGYYLNPLKPDLEGLTPLGDPDAPHTIVMYQDFADPISMKGYENIDRLLSERKDIKLYVKHLIAPHNSQDGKIAARYYEALQLIDPITAWDFRDDIFEHFFAFKNQGVRTLSVALNQYEVDYNKVITLSNSKEVLNKIKEDNQEALKFKITRTPSYILDGILIQGDHPNQFLEFLMERAELKRKTNKLRKQDKKNSKKEN